MNNKLVIYYSLDGNTKEIAEQIKSQLDCDIIRIKPKKDLKTDSFKLAKYFLGGKQAVSNKLPELESYNVNLDKYDTIFIGTPIWAGKISPAIKSFLHENLIVNKKIYLFCSHAGGGCEKAVNEYNQILGKENRIISTIDFKDALKNDRDINDRKIKTWLEGIIN